MSSGQDVTAPDVSPLPSLYEYDGGQSLMESDLHPLESRSWSHRRQISSMSLQSEAGLLVNVDKPLPELPSRVCSRHLARGWRFGVKVSAWTTFIIFLINVVLCIVAVSKFGAVSGIGTAYEGHCNAVDNYATWLHILINILSTLLLAASTYTMQCLAAPTRAEVDQAHARGDWLDIGILSLRNIFKLKRSRIALWLVLALSSIPIHAVYNSTIFKTLSSNQYQALVVNEAFLDGAPLTLAFTADPGLSVYESDIPNYFSMQHNYLSSPSNYTNLSITDCLTAYANDYVVQYNDLLLVTHDSNTSDGVVYSGLSEPVGEYLQPYLWICHSPIDSYDMDFCDVPKTLQNITQFEMYGVHPAYCLAQQTVERCQLQFSTVTLAIVIACNCLKGCVMLILLHRFKTTPTLVIIGDAIASFLIRPDTTTFNARNLDRKTAIAKAR